MDSIQILKPIPFEGGDRFLNGLGLLRICQIYQLRSVKRECDQNRRKISHGVNAEEK